MVAEVTKPDFSYVWSSGGANVLPSAVKIQTGWTAEVPPFQWENAIQNRQDNAIVHLFQKGISEWDANSNYYFTTDGVRSYVQGSDGVIYVAVQDSIGQNPTTDLSDTYWKVAFASAEAGYLTQTAGDARYAQRANNLSDLTNTATARTNLSVYSTTQTDSAISLAPSIQGMHRNLKVSTTGLSALVSLTVDSITVGIPGGNTKTLDNISLPSISLAASGVNGLDTGISSASTWYGVWVIWNGTTVAGLLSLSTTAPTMPSGYTYRALVSMIRSDSTASKFPLSFLQINRHAQYVVVPSSNVPRLPLIISGVSGSPTTGSYTAVSSVGFFPINSAAIHISLYSSGASVQTLFAPNNNYGAGSSTTNLPFININNGSSNANLNNTMARVVPESSQLYYASNATVSSLSAIGWEL